MAQLITTIIMFIISSICFGSISSRISISSSSSSSSSVILLPRAPSPPPAPSRASAAGCSAAREVSLTIMACTTEVEYISIYERRGQRGRQKGSKYTDEQKNNYTFQTYSMS